MNKLKEMWRWKLLITIIYVSYMSFVLLLGNNTDYFAWILVLTVLPVCIWISITISMDQYRKELLNKK